MPVRIVDNGRSSLMRLQHLVERAADGRTMTFTNPEAALGAVSEQRFGVVLVDHIMPNLDGFMVVRPLRAMDRYEPVPIVDPACLVAFFAAVSREGSAPPAA